MYVIEIYRNDSLLPEEHWHLIKTESFSTFYDLLEKYAYACSGHALELSKVVNGGDIFDVRTSGIRYLIYKKGELQ